MSYRIKRIDPFWRAEPFVAAVAAAGVIIGALGANSGSTAATAIGALAACAAVFAATKPALSAVFATFGLIGGAVAFIAGSGGLDPLTRLGWTAAFGAFYMIVMDVVVLGVAALYNIFTRLGFSGMSLRLES